MKYQRCFTLIVCIFTVFIELNAQNSNPNIIIILADDLGWGDVGYHGSSIKTPNIDRLSQEGIELDRYYVTPICSPTRAGLLTGRYPDRFGLRKVVVRPWFDFGLDTTQQILPQMLAQAGYENRAIIGKWHLGHSRPEYHPLKRGFTHFYGHFNGAIDYFTHTREGEQDWHRGYEVSNDKGYTTDLITTEAVKSIKRYSGNDSPFFLYVAYNAPHTPLQAQKKYLKMYGAEDNDLTNVPNRQEKARKIFSAMVTNMDDGIGEILQTLEELGISDNTLVLFHSDNGGLTNVNNKGGGASNGQLRGEKLEEWEGGVRVPAIIKWPKGFEGERKLNQVMGYVDIVPTLRNIVGMKPLNKNQTDGIDLWPILNNEVQHKERNLYLGRGAIINQEWKLIKTGQHFPHTLPRMELKENVLFNISEDPYEKDNKKEEQQEIFKELFFLVSEYDAIEPSQTPPVDAMPEGFKVPKNWKLKCPQQDD